MIKNCVSTIIASMMVLFLQAQGVTISPEFPERGDTVTVTYDNAQATSVTLNFPYSNFYDVPYVIKLEKTGNLWTTSFKLARYATFAAFYL